MASTRGTAAGRRKGSRAQRLALIAALSALAAACSVTPEPLTVQERQALAAADHARLFTAQEPVSGPITLGEALARAIKYNLDYRAALMEEALQARHLDVSRYDMLPKLAANAGYINRDSELETLSRNTRTGATAVDPSISQDKTRYTADLGLTWNILDFGVSYYQAKQQANRVLVAQERRRRIINSIIQQVRSIYWMAATTERIGREIEPILSEARAALDDARTVERERLQPPLESLRFQKALIEIVRQLEAVQQEHAIAKAQLAALMNVPLGQPYTLALPETPDHALPTLPLTLDQMEAVALLRRPEIQEEHYQNRINAAEVHKAMVRMLPGISLSPSINYDSNSYLVNPVWAEIGARVTVNLLNIVSGPASIRAAETQEEVGDLRRMAVSMAAITQVHVAVQQMQRARASYVQARELESIERRINDQVQSAGVADAESALERIRAKASAINATLARDRAYAEFQNTLSTVYVSLGLDPLPDTVPGHSIPELSAALTRVAEDWQSGRMPADLLPDAPVTPAEPADPTAPAAGPRAVPVS